MAATMLTKGPRLAALDAVRALAILLVIGHHAAYRFPGSKDDVVAAFLRAVGWIGVDVFFALSGFLIVRILIRDAAAHDLPGFFRRRFYRIVPIFAVALAVFVVAALLTGQERELLPRIWMPALFLNGWMIPFFGVDGVPYVVAWSLSVEEFAYIVLGFCAIWARPGLWRGVMACLLVAIVLRWLVVLTGWFDKQYLYYFVPARLDAIAFGGLGALGVYDRIAAHRYSAWIAGLCTIGLMIVFQWTGGIAGWFLPAFGYALFGLSCAVWVVCLAQPGRHHSGRLVALVAPFGKVSYFIYLFHLFVLAGVALAAKQLSIDLHFWPAMAISVLLCFVLAKLSWHVFEYPLIRRSHDRS